MKKRQFVLWANRVSSYYGTDWLRAALVTLSVTAVCYVIYLGFLGYRPGSDVDKFCELASHTLSYLNPFRDEDTGQLMELIRADLNGKIPPLARIWDYISRIIVAFMVYQTIAAFRRLGRSGS